MSGNLNKKNTEDSDNKKQFLSPTYGNAPQEVMGQGMEKVGKHGKSHIGYFKVMEQHTPEKERHITLEELSTHRTKQSAWLSLRGEVYDVTVYIDYHPGGDIMLQGCGKECSALFEHYHPWVNAKHLLAKYKLGYLKA